MSLGQGGTSSGLMSVDCMADQTKRRIYELSERGMQELSSQNPNACSGNLTAPAGLANCVAGEFTRADKHLNSSYRSLLARAANEDESIGENNAGERPSLIKAERAWITFRDAQCGYFSARIQEGEARLAAQRCRTVMTLQRAKELEEL
jgi:uncharacterized protein YecT (DUF1311 family)